MVLTGTTLRPFLDNVCESSSSCQAATTPLFHDSHDARRYFIQRIIWKYTFVGVPPVWIIRCLLLREYLSFEVFEGYFVAISIHVRTCLLVLTRSARSLIYWCLAPRKDDLISMWGVRVHGVTDKFPGVSSSVQSAFNVWCYNWKALRDCIDYLVIRLFV